MGQPTKIGAVIPQAKNALTRQCESSPQTARAVELRAKFGNETEFLTVFNPSQQARYVQKIERCINGSAPKLRELNCFEPKTAENWLVIQLFDLFEFSGAKKDDTGVFERQLKQLAEVIELNYSGLKVTELMIFFQQFKAGKYGKFYGSIDPLTVTVALGEFFGWLKTERNRLEEIEERKRKEESYRRADRFIAQIWEIANEITHSTDCSDLSEVEKALLTPSL